MTKVTLFTIPSPGNELTKIMSHLDELEVLLPADTAPYLTALRALSDLNRMANRVSMTVNSSYVVGNTMDIPMITLLKSRFIVLLTRIA